MRILVTGSRDWADRASVWSALSVVTPPNATIVHGGCPTGADLFAKEWARLQPDVTEEAHPADWEKYGKAAGPIRNQQMVDMRADLCLAFPLGNSRGTRHCMARAKAAGIVVLLVEP